jgi:hypothetical protein
MFESLFGRKNKSTNPLLTFEQLEGKSVESIKEYLRDLAKLDRSPPVNAMQDVSRRLIDITYFDENASIDDRIAAEKTEAAIWKSIENGLQNNPAHLNACSEARSKHIASGRASGVFSLMHKVTNGRPEDVLDTIVQLESAPLLPEFPRDVISGQRGPLISTLLKNRAQVAITSKIDSSDQSVTAISHTNAVITAGWLILTRDPTALWAFDVEERQRLGRWLESYPSAQNVLLSLSIGNAATPTLFGQPTDSRVTCDVMLRSCAEGTSTAGDESPLVPHTLLSAMDASAYHHFLTQVFCLRLWLWKKMLTGVHGTSHFESVKTSNANANWPEATDGALNEIEKLYETSLGDDSRGSGLPNLLVAFWVLDLIDRDTPKESQDATVKVCAQIFSNEIFHFSHYVRFLLAFLVHGNEAVELMRNEDALE